MDRAVRVEPSRRRHFRRALLAGAAALAFVACSRSGLEADDWQWIDGVASPDDPDAGLPDAAQPDVPLPGTGGASSVCVPSEEVCNGVDDDCNGLVDEVAPIPCPGGGEQYCVAGSFSACPKPCETCMPGSERICFMSYCKYWAVQTCTADGKAFGKCQEQDPPPECKGVAKDKKYSKELEQCCVDNGYCCLDEFDLDQDGNEGEMIGNCEEVLCTP